MCSYPSPGFVQRRHRLFNCLAPELATASSSTLMLGGVCWYQEKLSAWQAVLQTIKISLFSKLTLPSSALSVPLARIHGGSYCCRIGSRYTLSRTLHGSPAIYLILASILFCISYSCLFQGCTRVKAFPAGKSRLAQFASYFIQCLLLALAHRGGSHLSRPIHYL
jgi:hypothetical protein